MRMRRRKQKITLTSTEKMATLIRIAAVLAAIYAAFVYFTTEKNRDQLQIKQDQLKASQAAYDAEKARYEEAVGEGNSLRKDIRLMRREVKELVKQREETIQAKKEAREDEYRKKQERHRKLQAEEAEREAEAERIVRETEKEALAARTLERDLTYAKEELSRLQTPPYVENSKKDHYGVLDRVNSAWTTSMRSMQLAVSKKDSKKIRAEEETLRKLAKRADRFSGGVEYTQQSEEVMRVTHRILQLLQKTKEDDKGKMKR